MKQEVMRVDKSPMNPKRKCVELKCGHEVWVSRAPKIGALIDCSHCAKREAQP